MCSGGAGILHQPHCAVPGGTASPLSPQHPLSPLLHHSGTLKSPLSPPSLALRPQYPFSTPLVPSLVALGPQCPLLGGPGTPMSPLSSPCWLWDPQIASMPLWFPHGGSGIPTSPQRPPGPLPSVPTSPAVPHPISAGHGGQKSATTAGDDVPHVLRFGADAGGDVDLIALGTGRGHGGDAEGTQRGHRGDTGKTQGGYGGDTEWTWSWDTSFSPALSPPTMALGDTLGTPQAHVWPLGDIWGRSPGAEGGGGPC